MEKHDSRLARCEWACRHLLLGLVRYHRSNLPFWGLGLTRPRKDLQRSEMLPPLVVQLSRVSCPLLVQEPFSADSLWPLVLRQLRHLPQWK